MTDTTKPAVLSTAGNQEFSSNSGKDSPNSDYNTTTNNPTVSLTPVWVGIVQMLKSLHLICKPIFLTRISSKLAIGYSFTEIALHHLNLVLKVSVKNSNYGGVR